MADDGKEITSSTKQNGNEDCNRPGNRNRKSPNVFDDVAVDEENEPVDDGFFNGNEIKIMIGTGKTISLEVKGSDTVANVKLKIQVKHGIAYDQQELLFDKMVLHDAYTLSDLPIKKESILKLLHKSRGPIMYIYIKPARGRTRTLDVKPSDTIGMVKSQMRDEFGVDVLMFDETVLDDSGTLDYYDITHGSTLIGIDKSGKEMDVFVNNFSGKTVRLRVKPTYTVAQLKSMIEWRAGDITVDEKVLIFNNVVLGDAGTLFDFHITRNVTLKLIRKSRGVPKPMQVFVKPVSGETISLQVKPTDNIDSIKAMIQDKMHIPCDEQELIFNDMALHNTDTLAGCNISGDSMLTLMRISTGFMHIVIKTLIRKTINLEVRPTDTIREVRSMIQAKEEYPLGRQELIFEGKKLLESATLAAYNIPNDSVLYLVLRTTF